jgi:hypothetical protein
MKKPHVYVTQYNAWWRLTVDEWVEVCMAGAYNDHGYSLEGYRELKNKPRYARHVFKPLDWEKEDFVWAIGEARTLK